jgi:hypothetical protein
MTSSRQAAIHVSDGLMDENIGEIIGRTPQSLSSVQLRTSKENQYLRAVTNLLHISEYNCLT